MKPTRNQRLRELSRERRDNEKKELRQAILDAAGELFLRHGYAGFSLRQVAEHIGYAASTIYLYFDDKDHLLFNVADEGFRLFSESQQRAAASTDDPADRLRAMARAYVTFGLENPAYYRLMFIERPDLMFKSRKPEAQAWLGTLNAYQQVFRTAVQAGILRAGDEVAMSDAWWAMLHGIVALATSMPFIYDRQRVEPMVGAALEMFFEGFSARR